MTVKVRVKPLSFYKDILGSEQLEATLDSPQPTVGHLLDHLEKKAPQLSKYRGTPLLNILVNGNPATEEQELTPGDEVALLPTPSGG